MSIGLMCHFKANISLLIFCLDDLSRAVNWVFWSPTMIVSKLVFKRRGLKGYGKKMQQRLSKIK